MQSTALATVAVSRLIWGDSHDLQHDEADRSHKVICPVLVLWTGNMAKRLGWQIGARLNMLDTWRERARDVRGGPIDCGHFLPEEAPEEVVSALLGFWSQ